MASASASSPSVIVAFGSLPPKLRVMAAPRHFLISRLANVLTDRIQWAGPLNNHGELDSAVVAPHLLGNSVPGAIWRQAGVGVCLAPNSTRNRGCPDTNGRLPAWRRLFRAPVGSGIRSRVAPSSRSAVDPGSASPPNLAARLVSSVPATSLGSSQ